ncbi:MAG: hypothetical protein GKR90_27385 [Pseudomonadales bacterium]|nr:hypothetical protein [Pseudomonadales bacterium]
MKPEYLALLDEFSPSEHEHEKGTLRDHLVGTYNLLSDWDNPVSVALGGLFHSIYGTQYYRTSSTGLNSRSKIADIIGEEAEELAYLFCVTDRNGFIYEAGSKSPSLWNCVENKLCPVKPTVIKDLIEIEAANFIEQRHLDRPMAARYVTLVRHTLERGGPFMSPKARDAYAEVVGRTIEVSAGAG